MTVEFASGPAEVKGKALADLLHGWAITVHRAQGSEFPAVVVVLPPEAGRMLSRPLVYTALTRAQRHLSIVHAAGPAVARAVRQIGALPRRTRLIPLLREYVQPADRGGPQAVGVSSASRPRVRRAGLPRGGGALGPFLLQLGEVLEEVDLDRVPLRAHVALLQRAVVLVDLARASRPADGSVAVPSSRSATHSDCASASGMIAPSGCTSPMKYSPGCCGSTTRWNSEISLSCAADQRLVEEREA